VAPDQRWRLCRAATGGRFLALERGAILHPRWKELACDLYGSYRQVSKASTVIKESALSRNHLRFRISPEMTIARHNCDGRARR